MNEQAKTVVVFWNYLNSEGADGRNARKRAQRALNREFICWPRGTAWLVYIPSRSSVEYMEAVLGKALGSLLYVVEVVADNDNHFVYGASSVNFNDLRKKFGGYVFEGKVFCGVENMYPSNRLFDGCYSQVEDGEEYVEEWTALGYDIKGNRVQLYMQFKQVKGQEVEPENLNWSKYLSRVEYL